MAPRGHPWLDMKHVYIQPECTVIMIPEEDILTDIIVASGPQVEQDSDGSLWTPMA